jgi:glycosyltransferase involved in cell wall biosynthesis
MPSISYLITCHNEDTTLENLLTRVVSLIDPEDEIIVLDDFSDSQLTKNILSRFSDKIKIYQHALDKNYGGHKNYGNSKCSKEWIFQLDGDELPNETLLINIKDIIQSNPEIDLYAIPRVNDFKGVTSEDAKQWGWRLTPEPSIIHEKIIDTNSSEYKFLKENGYIIEETKV